MNEFHEWSSEKQVASLQRGLSRVAASELHWRVDANRLKRDVAQLETCALARVNSTQCFRRVFERVWCSGPSFTAEGRCFFFVHMPQAVACPQPAAFSDSGSASDKSTPKRKRQTKSCLSLGLEDRHLGHGRCYSEEKLCQGQYILGWKENLVVPPGWMTWHTLVWLLTPIPLNLRLSIQTLRKES